MQKIPKTFYAQSQLINIAVKQLFLCICIQTVIHWQNKASTYLENISKHFVKLPWIMLSSMGTTYVLHKKLEHPLPQLPAELLPSPSSLRSHLPWKSHLFPSHVHCCDWLAGMGMPTGLCQKHIGSRRSFHFHTQGPPFWFGCHFVTVCCHFMPVTPLLCWMSVVV